MRREVVECGEGGGGVWRPEEGFWVAPGSFDLNPGYAASGVIRHPRAPEVRAGRPPLPQRGPRGWKPRGPANVSAARHFRPAELDWVRRWRIEAGGGQWRLCSWLSPRVPAPPRSQRPWRSGRFHLRAAFPSCGFGDCALLRGQDPGWHLRVSGPLGGDGESNRPQGIITSKA